MNCGHCGAEIRKHEDLGWDGITIICSRCKQDMEEKER